MKTLVIGLAVAALMSGCATKEYVNEQIAAADKRMDSKSAELGGKIDQTASNLDGRLNQQQASIDGVSRTAKEALERANTAGKLAEGKFMYETTLSSQIAFDFESNTLTPAAKEALDAFAGRVKSENKNVYIEIQGHTDSSGSVTTNMKLGQARAEAVHRYLAINGGIALHRMNVISYGESAPIADNKTRAGRMENRRVTLVVLQ
jgi:outer membrane protein OmpA-like peptidoglycan-associated protein